MVTLHIDLNAHQTEFLDRLVAEGVYEDASEAIADGLRRIESERNEQADKQEALRSAVQAGFDDADAGNYFDVSTREARASFWDGIRADVADRADRRAATG